LDAGARRDALVRDLEAAITRDARARARRGVLDGPIAHTRCERAEIAGEERFARVFGRYQCLAVSSTNRSVRGHPFETGYPFVATIHYRQLRYVWCKLNPRPGEKAAGKATAVVPVPRVCAGPLASIY
jgi:hypothetical protein